MNLEDIAKTLPWGLHDAYLEAAEVDWARATVSLTLRVMMTRHQEEDQRAKVTVTGLAFFVVDPPRADFVSGDGTGSAGLWIDAGEGPANEAAKTRLPKIPEGHFLHWLFVSEWNSFIHICGRHAELVSLEQHPVAARAGTRALFPGEDTEADGT